MSVQQPAWLKKSRPCPFFSQGRCLFADSCNFLHDVKVRNALTHPLPGISQVQQPSLRSASVLESPFVLVNSASPRSVNSANPDTRASPIQDSSRYSGLLSVLSDVIGPPPGPLTTAEDVPQPTSYITRDTVESDFVVSCLKSNCTVIQTETKQAGSNFREPSSILQFDSEATLVDPLGYQTESFFPEEGGGHATEFLPIVDDAAPAGEDTHSYVAEGTERCGGNDHEHVDDNTEEDVPVIVSNRYSNFSSFTGASLLASPRNGVFGEFSAPEPTLGSILDLLSPVELSAKLRPFSIPKVKRGDSIDSGYADGDSWGPLPFPRSPPRNFRSSLVFPSHSRRASHSSLVVRDNRASHCTDAYNPAECLDEVESCGSLEHGSEDYEDTAYTILVAYDTSPSGGQGGDRDGDSFSVNFPALADSGKVKQEVPTEVSPVMCSPQRHSPERLHPIRECDLDTCNLPSFVSDDNLSFKTALSVQPPNEDINDVSKVSLIERGSYLSSSSISSAVNTHYSDANEPLGHRSVKSHVFGGSSYLVATGPASSSASGTREAFPEKRPSSIKDVLEYAPPDVISCESGSPVTSSDLHGYLEECAAVQADQSLSEEDGLRSDEVTESLDSECDNFAQRLLFPLPPPFLPAEFVGPSTISGVSKTTVTDMEEDVSSACTKPQEEKEQRMCPDSGLMENVQHGQSPSVNYTDSGADFTSQRSRAASDLTVKGKSPQVTTPQGALFIATSPSPPLELQGRLDSVQSLYDQYFDDNYTRSPGSVHQDTTPPDTSNASEYPSQEVHLLLDYTPRIFQRDSSDNKPSCSSTDSLRSEAALRPLLTGRRSFLGSSLTGLIPKTNLDNIKEVTSGRLPTRLQAKEIGSTVVPLGFRRHKPQPAARMQTLQTVSQSLHVSQLREALRIRTDISRDDLPPGCSSAHVSSAVRSPLPAQSMSAPPTGGLKELQLSSVIHKRSSILSTHSSSIASSTLSLDHLFNSPTPQSPSVSSTTSFSHNSLLSSSCEQIPGQTRHTLRHPRSDSPIPQATNSTYFAPQPFSTCDSRSTSVPIQQSWRASRYRAGSRSDTLIDSTHRFSRRASTLSLSFAVDEEQEIDEDDRTVSHIIRSNHVDSRLRPASVLVPPVHAIATPKPTLLFAIASDDVDQVRRVLENGEAGPNDSVGPQSALAFTLTNDKLTRKQEIVKALLAYGANPSALRNPAENPTPRTQGTDGQSTLLRETTLEGMDPATRYFIVRADAAHTRQTSQLIYRSFFRPLTRVRYDVIGQDWALEQLFRVLSMHSQKLSTAPIVVFLCGPSGHGKSLLARKFGSLLDVPTHTVNMTTLRSTHDIWQSFSMSPYEEPSSCTLAEFLIAHEGKRCVVVLDEIEKVEDQKALWSLLMPWELGRCSLEAGKRHVDARNVIWLATSNIGHELVFEYHENRAEPDQRMSRKDYLELTDMLRPRISHYLGASLVSRVTTVLPFVPFTLDEKKAIAAESVYTFARDSSKALSPQEVELLVTKALPSYQASEGARSLHRAISNILIDMI